MIVTSETTALVAMTSAARTGRPAFRNAHSGDAGPAPPRIARPSARNRSTGTPTAPNRPSGSRAKILISSQTSCHKPFIGSYLPSSSPAHLPRASVSNRAPRQPEEHVLERRLGGVEIGDRDAVP